jgi:hypothetical protein
MTPSALYGPKTEMTALWSHPCNLNFIPTCSTSFYEAVFNYRLCCNSFCAKEPLKLIQHREGLNLCRDTCRLNWGFSWFLSALREKFRDSTSLRHGGFIPNPLQFVTHRTILRHMVSVSTASLTSQLKIKNSRLSMYENVRRTNFCTLGGVIERMCFVSWKSVPKRRQYSPFTDGAITQNRIDMSTESPYKPEIIDGNSSWWFSKLLRNAYKD